MPFPRFKPSLSMLAGVLVLAGCSGLILAPSDPGFSRDEPGLHGLQPLEEGELASATGCTIAYRLYRPAEVSTSAQASTLVILGHGFLRSQQRMTELAETIAAAGIPVATLDYCNMRFWDGRHQQNGLDMIALARHLGSGSGSDAVAGAEHAYRPHAERADGSHARVEHVIYAGFSAGALAALVAARNDPNALGAVTLDLVNAQGIGERAARDLDKPLIGLAGEATNCNANDNARVVFAATDQARLMSIAGAGHCDFEAPTDALCELVCTDPDQADANRTAQLREQIRSQTLAAIESLMDGSLAARQGERSEGA
jgi:dienelactone hydrolase